MSTKLYDISNWCKQGIEVEDYPYVGEVNIDLTMGEILEVGGDCYAIGVLNNVNKSAGVRQVEIDFEPEDKDYENNLICPYCGYEDKDSWELSDDDEEHECGRCGAVISYQRVVTVEYSSSPVKPPSVVTAKWV